MSPKLSIIYLSYRPAGYDVLVDSLVNQTFQDYELIVVDDYLERNIWESSQYLKEHGIKNFKVSRSKQKCFPETAFNLINAYNTGLLLSTGDLIVILNDYTWLPENTFERIMENYDLMMEGCALSGVGDVYECPPPPHLDGKFEAWDTPWKGHPAMNGLTLRHMWVPNVFELFFSIIPYHILVKTNGFPECYDYANNNQVEPMIQMLCSFDVKLGVDNDLHVIMLNHRDWGKDAGMWHLSKKKPEGDTCMRLRENTFNLKTHTRGTLP